MEKSIKLARDKLVETFNKQAKVLIDDHFDLLFKDRTDFFAQLTQLARQIHASEGVPDFDFHEDHIPCLIVAPHAAISIQTQIHRLYAGLLDQSRGNWEEKFIRHCYKQRPDVPNYPYLIFDVEPGKETGGDICFAANKFNREDRRGLTGEEAMSLLRICPDILTQKSLYLIGSPKDPRGKVLALEAGKGARLFYSLGTSKSGFGIPSAMKLSPV